MLKKDNLVRIKAGFYKNKIGVIVDIEDYDSPNYWVKVGQDQALMYFKSELELIRKMKGKKNVISQNSGKKPSRAVQQISI